MGLPYPVAGNYQTRSGMTLIFIPSPGITNQEPTTRSQYAVAITESQPPNQSLSFPAPFPHFSNPAPTSKHSDVFAVAWLFPLNGTRSEHGYLFTLKLQSAPLPPPSKLCHICGWIVQGTVDEMADTRMTGSDNLGPLKTFRDRPAVTFRIPFKSHHVLLASASCPLPRQSVSRIISWIFSLELQEDDNPAL